MRSRRQYLAAAGAALSMLAGCSFGGDRADTPSTTLTDNTNTATPTASPTDTGPSPTPHEDWRPGWTAESPLGDLYALTRTPDGLYATLDAGDGSAVAAVDRSGEGFGWRTEFEGPITGSSLAQTNARDDRSVTVGDGTLYVVTSTPDDYELTELHALDPETGDQRWSVRRERKLSVAGVLGETVVVGAREFFVPESTHDTPEAPLTTIVAGLDAATGEVRWRREFRGVRAGATAGGQTVVGEYDEVTGLGVDGDVQWSAATTDPRAVLSVGDRAVVAGVDGDGSRLRAFDPDGTERWQARRPVEEFLAVGDRLYALGEETVAYDADGSVRWQVSGYSQWPLLSPDGGTLYARAAIRANAVDAFDLPGGGRRFRFETPSNDGWPVGATEEMVVAEAITPDLADFTSLYAVDSTAGEQLDVYRPTDTVFDVVGVDGTAYAAIGSRLLAFDRPG